MTQKHYLITGATDGIGKATALELAKSGAVVVLVGRNPDKTAHVLDEIRAQSYNKNVSALIADLSSQAQVRSLAQTYLARYKRLDVLINNAGGYFYQRQETVDGLELSFALNHLAYFMLTGLLMDCILATGEKTGDARIVNVTSDAHEFRRQGLLFDDLQTTQHYNAMKAYSQSKLANILFTYELARHLRSTPVMVNCLHPGFVHTGFTRNAHQLAHKVFNVFSALWAISPEKGAETSVYLANSDEMRGKSGDYYIKCKAVKSNNASYDESQWKQLWEVSLQLTGIPDFPAIRTNQTEV